MMKQHNQHIKHRIMVQIKNGHYDLDDHVQKWAAFLQISFVEQY